MWGTPCGHWNSKRKAGWVAWRSEERKLSIQRQFFKRLFSCSEWLRRRRPGLSTVALNARPIGLLAVTGCHHVGQAGLPRLSHRFCQPQGLSSNRANHQTDVIPGSSKMHPWSQNCRILEPHFYLTLVTLGKWVSLGSFPSCLEQTLLLCPVLLGQRASAPVVVSIMVLILVGSNLLFRTFTRTLHCCQHWEWMRKVWSDLYPFFLFILYTYFYKYIYLCPLAQSSWLQATCKSSCLVFPYLQTVLQLIHLLVKSLIFFF